MLTARIWDYLPHFLNRVAGGNGHDDHDAECDEHEREKNVDSASVSFQASL